MSIRYNEKRLNQIKREIEAIKRRSNPAIEQTKKHLRELQEDWARQYQVPEINKLLKEAHQCMQDLKYDKSVAEKKATVKFSDEAHAWFKQFKLRRTGRYKLRWFGERYAFVTHMLGGKNHWRQIVIDRNIYQDIESRTGNLKEILSYWMSKYGDLT